MAGQRGVVGVDDREARRAQDWHLILGEMGEVAGADERVLAPCDIGLALGPDPGDLILDQTGFEGRGSAARALNPWKRSQATRQS